MRLRAWSGYLVLAAVLTGSYLSLPWLVPDLAPAGQFALNLVGGMSALLAVAIGIRRHRPAGLMSWCLFGAGLLAYQVGDLILFGYQDLLQVQAPFPGVSDAFYLGCYVLLAAGLVLLVRRRDAERHVSSLIDALIVSTGLGLLSWEYLIAPYATDPSLTLGERLVATAYPVFAVMLLLVIARLATGPGARSPAFYLITFGTGALLLAESAYGYAELNGTYSTGGLIDIGWFAYYACWAAAALHPSMRTMAEPMPRPQLDLNGRRLAVLATAALIAPGVLAMQGLLRQPIDAVVISIASSVLFLLVVLRMVGLLSRLRQQSTLLNELARTDALTGIANRRVWDETLPVELARAGRDGASRTVALLDLDRFKAFNDTYGHQAGDRLLTEAAGAWEAQTRAGDVLARYGGEEFILLLPSCAAEAVRTVERLRAVTPLGQTFSCGVVTWDGAESAAELVARVDAAMYRAKANGRDRIEPAQDVPASLPA